MATQTLTAYLAELKEAAAQQLPALAGHYTALKRQGAAWVGRCPLPTHTDERPSFYVYGVDAGRGHAWKCHGCGASGDALALVAAAEGLATKGPGFVDTVNRLAALIGADGPPTASPAQRKRAPVARKPRPAVAKPLELDAPSYLEPVPPQDVADTLGKVHGTHLARWLERLAERLGLEPAAAAHVLDAYGVGALDTHRVVFWFTDKDGVTWNGEKLAYKANGRRIRQTDPEAAAKPWLAHPTPWIKQTPTAKPRPCLFGAHLLAARPWAPVYVVEGAKTALAAALAWPQCVWVATTGAAGLSPPKAAQLKGRHVMLLLDNDRAGSHGAQRAMATLHAQGVYNDTTANLASLWPDAPKGADLADWLDYVLPTEPTAHNEADNGPTTDDPPKGGPYAHPTEEPPKEATHTPSSLAQQLEARNPYLATVAERLGLEPLEVYPLGQLVGNQPLDFVKSTAKTAPADPPSWSLALEPVPPLEGDTRAHVLTFRAHPTVAQRLAQRVATCSLADPLPPAWAQLEAGKPVTYPTAQLPTDALELATWRTYTLTAHGMLGGVGW